MNVSFLQNNPLDTVIINSANEQPLYEINTPWKLSGRTTTIKRIGDKMQGQIVAQVEWHRWSASQITFMGTKMPMDLFLPKSTSMMSNSRIVTGSDQRQYKWKNTSNKLTLVDCQTKAMVAQSHRRKGGLFSKSRKMNVDILPQGVQSIDAFVVSFIIMEEKRRQRARSSSAAAAGGAAGGGGGGGGGC